MFRLEHILSNALSAEPMDPKSELDLAGTLLAHPFAELLAEIAPSKLDGSLRVSAEERKSIIYFKGGRVVFAVSNARSSRLFDILLRQNKLSEDDLKQIPDFANDMALSEHLMGKSFITVEERTELFVTQIEGILTEALSWSRGDWHFSSLARIRDGLAFDIETNRLLSDYGHCLPTELVLGRFRSLNDEFALSATAKNASSLRPSEATVVSVLSESNPLRSTDIARQCQLPEGLIYQALYCLWLTGSVVRSNWNPAFTAIKLNALQNVRLELKQEAKFQAFEQEENGKQKETKESVEVVPEKPVSEEAPLTVEEYLERVESATNHYDRLGVEPGSGTDEFRNAYFRVAKSFHPDHYHKQGGELLVRLQSAFTLITQAHETLKNDVSRDAYDVKMYRELADREKQKAAGTYDAINQQLRQAAEAFELGLSLLNDDDAEAALKPLEMAAHFDPQNARFRAYHGKALSYDENKKHKAEAEMQAALKLDPNNPTLRILLVEFFIQMNMLKRAEGELGRLLAKFPSNREAQDLLASLQT